MPFVLLIIGILFLVIAIQGTQSQAFTMLRSEFSGNNSFVVFAAAIIILGALAYVKPIRPIAFAMIGLILLAMILANKGGFFAQLNNALRNPVTPNAVPATATTPDTVPNFSITPSANVGLGANVLGAPGSGSGAAGSPIPVPGL